MNKEIAKALRIAIETTLNDTFKISTRMESWSLEKGPLALEPFVACTIDMKENGASCGTFILAFSYETIAKAIDAYGIVDDKNIEILNDAAAEISNMIYGSFKTAVNKMGRHYCMEIPRILEHTRELSSQYQNDTKMILPFVADGHRCQVVVAPMVE
ncbi:MAG: chemotaxis protein CheX [Alphaproteobacteria bacterium]